MAEGKVLKSNGLLGERGRRRCNSRLGVGQLLSTFQLGLHDAVFGRQVFVPRQQLLVHRPRHVSQDARPIRKRPLPYPDSATASWTVREIVLSRLRNYYRRRPNHCSPAVSVFWPYGIVCPSILVLLVPTRSRLPALPGTVQPAARRTDTPAESRPPRGSAPRRRSSPIVPSFNPAAAPSPPPPRPAPPGRQRR